MPAVSAARIGLIAGRGEFPVLFARTASRRDVEVVAVAHRGETDPALSAEVMRQSWMQIYPNVELIELKLIQFQFIQFGGKPTVQLVRHSAAAVP